ncbi:MULTISPECIES: hypothetical protein [Staphylococcus]|uniref:hypothetical protein n=1 Tax=Staphylococcus TaxID=1279 RepID=UPI00026C0611|nr:MULTISPECIES: hypothetical protein [Staphylococcus]EJE22864.1 hypothetical protein HMPREF9976_07221 [Staphylococcus epidermidis NIHLM003]KDP68823.1 hypothetical protein SEVCU013_1008 [Staphylococcus epidermidis VCU013]UTF65584.1 hypothetical protein MNU53_00175 [Staphylococcus epidermidis]
MNQERINSDWKIISNCLASQNYISIVKGLVNHSTGIKDEEILDKIFQNFMDDDRITTVLNKDLQTIINKYI